MNPFALVNDKDNKVNVFVDKRAFEATNLTFHPMENNASIEIATEDFKHFLNMIGKSPIIVDFLSLKKGET